MKLDRDLQRVILTKLSDIYPEGMDVQKMVGENPDMSPNLFYLREHGMIEGNIARPMAEPARFVYATITAAGMDFLADDGGLTAILGMVTVKLHDETIRDLIEVRIQSSDLPAEEKTGLLHQLKELRGESIKHLTMKLLDAGLENAPVALLAIQTFLTHVPK